MKKLVFIAVLLLVGVSYGQNFTSSVGLYDYDALQSYKSTDEYKMAERASKQERETMMQDLMALNKASRNKIDIRKASKKTLVRYKDAASMQLIDFKGEVLNVKYSKKYGGLVVPKTKQKKVYFLKVVEKDTKETFMHKVQL